MIIRGIGKQYYEAISFFSDKLRLPDSILIDFTYSNKMNVHGLCWRNEHIIFVLSYKQNKQREIC